ncbi:hypothetical protein AAMO2058_001596900 [Amorphochlora amoebiformis]
MIPRAMVKGLRARSGRKGFCRGYGEYVADFEDIIKAAERIRGIAKETPVLTCRTLDRMYSHEEGSRLFFKCENFQKTGSFKFRGALNAVSALVEENPHLKSLRVVTQSSGNHGQALAACAKVRDVPATIVMPHTAPSVKKAAVMGYGAQIVECEPTDQARDIAANEVIKTQGGLLIHPNQDPYVIAGQGTMAMELLNQIDDLDAIVAPVGGGGMISGIALWARHIRGKGIKIIAAEPKNADDCFQSISSGKLTPNASPPVTIADGVRVSIGENTWPIIRDMVDDVVCVSEQDIHNSTRLVWERMKLVIEPSSGVGVAAVLSSEGKKSLKGCKKVGIVLCGGNVDLAAINWEYHESGPG